MKQKKEKEATEIKEALYVIQEASKFLHVLPRINRKLVGPGRNPFQRATA